MTLVRFDEKTQKVEPLLQAPRVENKSNQGLTAAAKNAFTTLYNIFTCKRHDERDFTESSSNNTQPTVQEILLRTHERLALTRNNIEAAGKKLEQMRVEQENFLASLRKEIAKDPIVSLDDLTSIDLETEKATPLPNIYATLGMNNSPLEEIFADFVRKASRYSPKELDAMMNVESTVEKIEQAPVATLNEREVTVVKKGFFAKVVDGISATAQKVASIFKAIILAPVRLVKAIAITTAQVVKATGVFAISLASRPFRS